MIKKIGVFIVITVLVCAVSMPIFADTDYAQSDYVYNNTFSYSNSDIGSDALVTCALYITSHQMIIDSLDYGDSSTYCHAYNVYDVNVRFSNSSPYNLRVNGTSFKFQPIFTTNSNNGTLTNDYVTNTIRNVDGDLFSSEYFINTSGTVYMRYKYNTSDALGLVLPSGTSYNSSFQIYRECYYTWSASSSSSIITYLKSVFDADITSISNTFNYTITNLGEDTEVSIYNSDYNSQAIKENTQAILDAYTSNVQNAQVVTDGTDDNNSDLNTIHNQEQQWYSQNQSAIESTGLSNFNFSDTQVSGLNGVFSLFQRLWTSLGDFTFIYVFTLMISFATFVLRHRPSTRSTTKEKKVSSGSGGDSG